MGETFSLYAYVKELAILPIKQRICCLLAISLLDCYIEPRTLSILIDCEVR